MKRAGWVAWNVLTALSLLLCLATVALWLRSYRVCDRVGFGWNGGNCHHVESFRGRLDVLTVLGGGCVGGTTYRAEGLSPQGTWFGGVSGYPRHVRWRFGFVWQAYSESHFGLGESYTLYYHLAVVPYWFPGGVLALAPLAWLAGLRRRPGVIDLMLIVAAVALGLALVILAARAMNQSGAAAR